MKKLIREICNLNWFNLPNRLKSILKDLSGEVTQNSESIETINQTITNLPTSEPAFRSYAFNFSQSGTNPPTVNEYVNELQRTVTWTRGGAGIYEGTFDIPLNQAPNDGFTLRFDTAPNKFDPNFGTIRQVTTQNSIQVLTYNNAGALSDGIVAEAWLEFRAYKV